MNAFEWCALAMCAVAMCIPCPILADAPLGTVFTYQGQLKFGGSPVNNTADFEFTLWDDELGGNQVGPLVPVNGVDVIDGLFTVELDFGPEPFDGQTLWLEIAVRSPAGGGVFSTLDPRQAVTAAPFALKVPGIDGHSLDAADGDPVDAVFVDANGNVGIGTITPTSPLDVSGMISSSGPNGGTLRALNPGNPGASVTLSWLNNIPRIRVGGTGVGATNGLDIQRGGDVSLLRIMDNGAVGIGVTNPQYRLTVAGTIHSQSGGFRFPDNTTQTTAATGTVTSLGQGTGIALTPDPITTSGTVALDTAFTDARYVEEEQAAGGDLGGTYPDPTVTSLQQHPVSETAPANGQVLKWDGAQWGPGDDQTGGGSVWQQSGSDIYYTAGLVGIGTTAPSHPLHVTTSTGDRAVHAVHTATTGVALGVYGETSSVAAVGVCGKATAATATGVWGRSDGPDGVGVLGWGQTGIEGYATAAGGRGVFGAGGDGYGGYFATTGGVGVLGLDSATTGMTRGVYGVAQSNWGVGVVGEATSTSGLTTGVWGSTQSTAGRGVVGQATASSGTTHGVWGESSSLDGVGVYGNSATGVQGDTIHNAGVGVLGRAIFGGGANYGGRFESASDSGTGVYGYAYSNSGTTVGVLGKSDSPNGYGGYFVGRGYFSRNVGIGVPPNPTAELDVAGTARMTGFQLTTGASAGKVLTSDAGGTGTWQDPSVPVPLTLAGNDGSHIVKGTNSSTSNDSAGLFGQSTATSASTYGVYGQSASNSGRGVYGWASAVNGITYGVYGLSNSPGGSGVFGFANYTGPGTNYGGQFQAAGVSGIGAHGSGTWGVSGLSSDGAGRGVYGLATALTGTAYGGWFKSNSSSGTGVYGYAEGGGTTYGVRGEVLSANGYAGYFTGGRNYFSGNVGIGSTQPASALHILRAGAPPSSLPASENGLLLGIQSTTGYKWIQSYGGTLSLNSQGNSVAVATTDAQGFALAVNGSAAKSGGGSWSVLSDARMKQNVQPLDGALDRLLGLRGVQFEYTDEAIVRRFGLPGRQIGLIAQEVERCFPDWVAQDPEGFKYVTERGTTALMVEALRDLRAEKDAEIAALRVEKDTEIAALRAELEEIKSSVAALRRDRMEESE